MYIVIVPLFHEYLLRISDFPLLLTLKGPNSSSPPLPNEEHPGPENHVYYFSVSNLPNEMLAKLKVPKDYNIFSFSFFFGCNDGDEFTWLNLVV